MALRKLYEAGFEGAVTIGGMGTTNGISSLHVQHAVKQGRNRKQSGRERSKADQAGSTGLRAECKTEDWTREGDQSGTLGGYRASSVAVLLPLVTWKGLFEMSF